MKTLEDYKTDARIIIDHVTRGNTTQAVVMLLTSPNSAVLALMVSCEPDNGPAVANRLLLAMTT